MDSQEAASAWRLFRFNWFLIWCGFIAFGLGLALTGFQIRPKGYLIAFAVSAVFGLFGYYNAFEKRFAESEFTKALYRAVMPANTDRPMVIVLDEMNLAHPEQYFSVMLSKLENSAVGIRCRVMNSLANCLELSSRAQA